MAEEQPPYRHTKNRNQLIGIKKKNQKNQELKIDINF